MKQEPDPIRLSVVIPVHNAAHTLGCLLESLQPQLTDEREVICVDDGSSDGSAEVIARFPWVRSVRHEDRKGAGATRNAGARLARGECLLFLDADTRVRDPDLLRKAFGLLASHPELAAFSGCYHDHNPRRNLFARFLDTYEASLRIHAMDKEAPGSLNGSVCGLRRSVFDALGGFDEDPAAIMEDLDLGCRLGSGGLRHWFSSDLRVEHRQPGLWHYARELIPRTRYYMHLLRVYGLFSEIMGAKAEGMSRVVASLLLITLPWAWTCAGWVLSLLLSMALLVVRFPLWRLLWREQGPLFVPLGFFFYLATTIPIALGGVMGTWDAARGTVGKRLADVLAFSRYLKSLLLPHAPGYVIFFVTHRCNANCAHCFDREQRRGISQGAELGLERIRRLAQGMGGAGHLSLTGGEPFLREDLPEIVRAFYVSAGVRSFSISTNGSMPDRIGAQVPRILDAVPRARFILTLSVDGIGEEHDALRGVPGLFRKVEESYRILTRIRRRRPRLHVHACTTVSNRNRDTVVQTVRDLERKAFDQIEMNLVRGTPADPTVAPISALEYEAAMEAVKQANRKGQSAWDLARVFRVVDRMLFDIVRRSHEPWPCGTCVAGRKLLVIRANGDVLPCEVLHSVFPQRRRAWKDFVMGSLGDFNDDLRMLLRSERAERTREMIASRRCHCSFECAIMATMAYRPWNLPKVCWTRSRHGGESGPSRSLSVSSSGPPEGGSASAPGGMSPPAACSDPAEPLPERTHAR